MASPPALPRPSDFPDGTGFYVKEFDVPLARVPEADGVAWYNWYGGRPRRYDPSALRVDNNWPADSFDAWVKLIRDSL
ncbi:MAG: hypothetical protein R3298_05905 [Gammaproteobacteria bacterium]|nr:hypothetical protein [Gammaproteobacteria bacterium]